MFPQLLNRDLPTREPLNQTRAAGPGYAVPQVWKAGLVLGPSASPFACGMCCALDVALSSVLGTFYSRYEQLTAMVRWCPNTRFRNEIKDRDKNEQNPHKFSCQVVLEGG